MPVPPTVELLDAADAEVRQRRAAGALLARGCREGERVAFALGSSADLICAVLAAARVGLIPVLLNATLTPAERDLLADDAQPTVRIFSGADLARLTADGGGTGRPAELAPYPLTRPMHYTSGTTGRPKGVTTGIWDEATARAVFEDEAAVWHFDRRRPAPGLLADVPHRLGALLDGHAAGGRVARHHEPLRRRHRARHAAPHSARRPPSWSRPTCSGSSSARTSTTGRPSTHSASWPTPAPPVPRR